MNPALFISYGERWRGKLLAGTVAAARAIARKLAEEMGYEFVDVELAKEHGSAFLRVYIQHEQGLDLHLCEAYHRRLNSLVDHLEFDYLEVSSPGVDRPLKTDRDFARMIGRRVEIRLYRAVDGHKEFEGDLLSAEEEAVTIATAAGPKRFARRDIALARPALSYEALEENEEEKP